MPCRRQQMLLPEHLLKGEFRWITKREQRARHQLPPRCLRSNATFPQLPGFSRSVAIDKHQLPLCLRAATRYSTNPPRRFRQLLLLVQDY